MHDVNALNQVIHGHSHSTIDSNDCLAIVLSVAPTIFMLLNDYSGFFVSVTALLGGIFTAYRFYVVYSDRKKDLEKEKQLIAKVAQKAELLSKLDNRDIE